MAALRLKEAVLSRDQARAALLRLPILSTSLLSKPCIPPALGPRPSKTPCAPMLPSYNSRPIRLRHRRRKSEPTCYQMLSRLHLSLKEASGILSGSLSGRKSWFGISNIWVEIASPNCTNEQNFLDVPTFPVNLDAPVFPPLHNRDTLATASLNRSPSSVNVLVKRLYSLDESKWLVLQQPAQQDSLERAQETQQPPQQEVPRPQHQPPSERQAPSDKATPAQMSFILLKLREELPVFFDGHHSYHMYDDNLTFENNLSSFSWSSHSLRSYRMFLESSRLVMKLSFSQLELDLIKITKDVDQGKIEARWRVRGRPRYLLSLKERVLVDGFSTFLVNSSGLVTLHKMDRVMPAASKEKERNSWLVWLGSLVGVASPKSPLPQPELINSAEQPL